MNELFRYGKNKLYMATFPLSEQYVPMLGMGKRLRARAQELGLSDAEVARRAGLTPRAYSNYATDGREPDYAKLVAICQVLQTTPDHLLGVAPPPAVGGGDDEDVVLVPAYDLQASAGPGAFFDREQEIYRLPYRRQWLRSLTRAGFDELAVIEARGDSMEPTIRDGDSLLVDRSQTNPRRDGVFIIRWDDLVGVKRITADPGRRRLTVASDNPRYGTATGVRPKDLAVLGRVVWIGRRV